MFPLSGKENNKKGNANIEKPLRVNAQPQGDVLLLLLLLLPHVQSLSLPQKLKKQEAEKPRAPGTQQKACQAVANNNKKGLKPSCTV